MDKRLHRFETLYDTHADALWRYLYFRLGDRERAKELMHDVFLKAWKFVLDGKTIEHEQAFLYRIARNLFINEIRTDRRTFSFEVLSEAGFEAIAPEEGTDVQAERRELYEKLHMLEEPYQQVLIMRYIDGMAVKDIAAIMEEKESAISMRIKRGVENLRRAYSEGDNHEN